jgi:hypothetical protein
MCAMALFFCPNSTAPHLHAYSDVMSLTIALVGGGPFIESGMCFPSSCASCIISNLRFRLVGSVTITFTMKVRSSGRKGWKDEGM